MVGQGIGVLYDPSRRSLPICIVKFDAMGRVAAWRTNAFKDLVPSEWTPIGRRDLQLLINDDMPEGAQHSRSWE